MSESHDHDHDHDHGHDEGGHEIDRMPNARLFNLLFGLSALTLLSCIGVIQLFNMQVDALEHSRAEQGSFRIHEYVDEMNKQKSGWGKVEIKELDDKNTTTTRYYMPLASAKKAVLEDPNLLKALPPPQGWKTADDRAPAAAPPTKPVPTDGPGMRPQPPTPQPVPTDGAKPTEPPTPPPAEPTPPSKGEDAKAEDAKAEDAKAEDAKAEKPKPAKPRPPKPAPAKPTPEPAADTAG